MALSRPSSIGGSFSRPGCCVSSGWLPPPCARCLLLPDGRVFGEFCDPPSPRTTAAVDEIELIGPSVAPTDLLVRLFHEEQPRVYDPQPVKFGCSCSEDKVRQSLSIYSAKDIATMTTDEGTVTADCQFCGSHYILDPATVGFEAKDVSA